MRWLHCEPDMRRSGRAHIFIVAAGNSVDDGFVAYKMGTALSDRLIHLSVVAEAGDWITRYALPHHGNPAVTAFIRTRARLRGVQATMEPQQV